MFYVVYTCSSRAVTVVLLWCSGLDDPGRPTAMMSLSGNSRHFRPGLTGPRVRHSLPGGHVAFYGASPRVRSFPSLSVRLSCSGLPSSSKVLPTYRPVLGRGARYMRSTQYYTTLVYWQGPPRVFGAVGHTSGSTFSADAAGGRSLSTLCSIHTA